jgi:uncharacterized cupin superfamily protein
MRYISKYGRLILQKTDGTIAYRFNNHTLIVGDPTMGTGSENAIDYSGLIELFPSASTAAEKAGLNTLFWEAPVVTHAANLQDGEHYEVLTGSVLYNGVRYVPGEVFRFTTGGSVAFESGTQVALIPVAALEWYDSTVRNHAAKEYFKYLQLEWGDEAYWDGNRARAGLGFSDIR